MRDELLTLLAGIREDFQREEDQGLLQHDLHKAEQALAGKYACDRIERAIALRFGVKVVPAKSAGRAR
jgi:hypothetical protein